MKKLGFKITVFLVGIATYVSAQSIEASSYSEWTIVSPKMGTSLVLLFNNDFSVGGFYQQSVVDLKEEAEVFYAYEKEFFGMQVGCPLYLSQLLDVKLYVRVGAVNREHFSITPSIVSQLKVAKRVSLVAGMGVRALVPTIVSGLNINI